MLFSILQGGDPRWIVAQLLLTLPVILMALSIHEAAHGYAAYLCGDHTARNMGRLTLNPLKHLDLMGALCMLIVGYGWAKPVPVNTRNFRNPKRGMAITAAAGPLANLLLGVFGALLAGTLTALYSYTVYAGIAEIWQNVCFWGALLFQLMAQMNFLFMAFNLIPVPPFDGSRIALVFLPQKLYFKVMVYERQIMFGVLIAMLALSYFGFSPFGWIATSLTDLIVDPVTNGVWALLRPLLMQ